MDAVYVNSNTFKVMEDKTAEFNSGRRVKLDLGLDGIKFSAVTSSTYSAPWTTVITDESDLTASLTTVLYGLTQPGTIGSLPNHTHDDSEGSGGTISGTTYSGIDDHSHVAYVPWNFGANTISGTGDIYCNDIYTSSGTVYIGDLKLSTDGTSLLVDDQPIQAEGGSTTFSGLSDTPSTYDDGKYLRSTTSGTEWATVSGATGADGIAGADTTISGSYIKGVQSIKVEYATTIGIYINPGIVDVNNVLYENENRTTLFGSFVADTWYYVYASGDGTDISFTIASGVPTLDYSKVGYYNNNDRCIGFILTDTSGDIIKYHVDGERYHYYEDILTTINWQPLSANTNYDFGVHVPFGNMIAFMNLFCRSNSTSAAIYIGNPATPDADLNFWGQSTSTSDYVNNHQPVICDNNKQVRIRASAAWVSRIWTLGFQIPDYIYHPIGFSQITVSGAGGGTSDVQSFLDLTDTPASYSGTEGEYIVSTGSGIDFTQLSPAPAEGNWVLVATIDANNETISESISWDGDSWPRAMIETTTSGAANVAKMRYNNDSGSNYYLGTLYTDGGTVASSPAINDFSSVGGWSATSNRSVSVRAQLFLDTGRVKQLTLEQSMWLPSNTDYQIAQFSETWNNDSAKVTSLDFFSDGVTTSKIKVYRWRDITDIPVIKGKQSIQVEYATTSGIYINPGTIHMKDSYYGMYDLNTRTEVTVSGLATDTWYYVYTNISGSIASLDETNFTVASGSPIIDYPSMGYYDGNNRCIGFVYTDTSGYISRFKDTRGKYTFVKQINERPLATINGYEDVTHTAIPFGGMVVEALVMVDDAGSSIELLWPGDTSPDLRTNGLIFGRGGAEETIVLNYEVDDNKQIRFWSHASGVSVTSDGFRVATLGFYSPDYIYTGA